MRRLWDIIQVSVAVSILLFPLIIFGLSLGHIGWWILEGGLAR